MATYMKSICTSISDQYTDVSGTLDWYNKQFKELLWEYMFILLCGQYEKQFIHAYYFSFFTMVDAVQSP